MLDTLRTHAEDLRFDPPRVVVVRGAGERAFSVGADIDEWAAMTPADAMWASERGAAALDALQALPCPVVAMIHRHCLGGGLEVALACDLRLATSDAQLGFPEVTLGNATGWGGAARLLSIVGLGHAKELMLSGRTLDAEAAHRIGLVGRVVEPDALEDAVAE